jgi:hypothetical protein
MLAHIILQQYFLYSYELLFSQFTYINNVERDQQKKS